MNTKNLLILANIYASQFNLKLTTVGLYAANDGSFFLRLKHGKTCFVTRYIYLIKWFAVNLSTSAWPADIPRPPLTQADTKALLRVSKRSLAKERKAAREKQQVT